MATLITVKGPNSGREIDLPAENTILGRQSDSSVVLESRQVSRHHARIWQQDQVFFIEDLGSSNGTYINGSPITGKTPLMDGDTLRIGPYVFAVPADSPTDASEPEMVIQEKLNAHSSNIHLFGADAGAKLQVVLEISQHLARTLEIDALLGKLLDYLMKLFPHADRGLVLLCEGEHLLVRALRCRRADETPSHTYSRTIVRKALEDGVGVLSEDVQADSRFQSSTTLGFMNVRSLLCVPLISSDGQRLGIIQMDRIRSGGVFQVEDLRLLTAIALHAAAVLENASLHAELLREERLRQELAVARDIQQGFLPSDFPSKDEGFELFARVYPADDVAGDLYDFFPLKDGRLAFFVGDVSGKGIPAALFMVAVRTLGRHLAVGSSSPAQMLTQLNDALAADNQSGMFVTMIHGIYEPLTGQLTLASGGHPWPFLRKADGAIEQIELPPSRPLGCSGEETAYSNNCIHLEPGETFIIYTDGFLEAKASDSNTMFGLENLKGALVQRTQLTLQACTEDAKAAVQRFVRTPKLQDDLTLFLLRRVK